MEVVVDASIVVDWVCADSESALTSRLSLEMLERDKATVTAPRWLLAEVANALLSGVKQRRWSGEAADSSYIQLTRLPIVFRDDPADLDRAWNLSRRYDNHPVYDMLYVALAERLGARYLTADNGLRKRLAHLPWVTGPDKY